MAHVLVIDDDEAVTGTFARMLQTDGHEVTSATGAAEGLRHANARRPDAVILDIRMPAVDGVEFLRSLRQNPRTAGVPVAVVTGDYFVQDSVLRELDQLHAIVRYKPLWMADMSALVEALLGPAAHPAASKAKAGADR